MVIEIATNVGFLVAAVTARDVALGVAWGIFEAALGVA